MSRMFRLEQKYNQVSQALLHFDHSHNPGSSCEVLGQLLHQQYYERVEIAVSSSCILPLRKILRRWQIWVEMHLISYTPWNRSDQPRLLVPAIREWFVAEHSSGVVRWFSHQIYPRRFQHDMQAKWQGFGECRLVLLVGEPNHWFQKEILYSWSHLPFYIELSHHQLCKLLRIDVLVRVPREGGSSVEPK